MEGVRTFLETSTIHGLSYISTTKRLERLAWILIVIGGFTGAGVIIYQSFQSWDESPITTTIESLPIADINFPKITVCPPKNTYTALNYDLMMNVNLTLDNEIRDELENYALELLNFQLSDNVLKNTEMLHDDDRYYNWYHGFTKMQIPYSNYNGKDIYYRVYTSALNGNISTHLFNKKFDPEMVDTNVFYAVSHQIPDNIINNENVSLHVEIRKESLKDLSDADSYDSFIFDHLIDPDIKNISESYTPPETNKKVRITRNVASEDLKKQDLHIMPGFEFNWYYTGSVLELEHEPAYKDEPKNRGFVREVSRTIFFKNIYT